jgi:hypothetical protein
MVESRIEHLQRFNSILADLEEKVGGARTLAACSGTLPWPRRGVYFFMEHGETRTQSGDGPASFASVRMRRGRMHKQTSGTGCASIVVSIMAVATIGGRFFG